MKIWKRWMPITTLALPPIVCAAVVALATQPTPASATDTLDGKAIFLAAKCELCHAVPTAGIEAKTRSDKLRGPDMVNLAASHDAAWMTAYLRGDEALDGETHTKKFTGSDEELGALVSWLFDQEQ